MDTAEQKILAEFTRSRDDSSFRKLYRLHTPMIFALAVRLCGSRPEAEELTQEAWVRAVERHERFDGRSRYSTWLAGILVNCFRESARRRARAPAAFDDELGHAAASVVPAYPAGPNSPADAVDVERALSRLPEGYREVVILHDLNGYTHREIAAMLGIQEGTSKSQLLRGRARLRDLLTGTAAAVAGQDERQKS